MDEQQLVTAAQQGDKEAFGTLARQYQHALVAGARHLMGRAEDAEDMAQETLIEAYRHLPSLRDPGKFRAWLFGILRHRCHNHLRNARPAALSLDDYAEIIPAPLPDDSATLGARHPRRTLLPERRAGRRKTPRRHPVQPLVRIERLGGRRDAERGAGRHALRGDTRPIT